MKIRPNRPPLDAFEQNSARLLVHLLSSITKVVSVMRLVVSSEGLEEKKKTKN